jgi:hypothetical protein
MSGAAKCLKTRVRVFVVKPFDSLVISSDFIEKYLCGLHDIGQTIIAN